MRAGWGSMRAPLASQSTAGDLRFEREAGRDAGEGGGAEATDCREFTALSVFYAVPQIRAEPGQIQTCAGKGKAPFLKAESVWFARSGVGFYAAEKATGVTSWALERKSVRAAGSSIIPVPLQPSRAALLQERDPECCTCACRGRRTGLWKPD